MSPNPDDTWKVPPNTTWSAMISQEADASPDKGVSEWGDLSAREGPSRWKLLIVVIDCSYGPRLSNPPRSIRALKAKLAAALGIEALSKQSGTGGAEAASAQAIVSGVEGPQRHLIEQDDDLCGFWDRVATNPGVSEADAEEVRRISKSLTVPTSSLPGTMQHTWGS
ncbi:dnc, partial [Symbiodinium necroappetens]